MTGLGNCDNVIGEHLHGDVPWQLSASSFTRLALAIVEMLSASSLTVTGLGKCGNVIGEHLLGDWPGQL